MLLPKNYKTKFDKLPSAWYTLYTETLCPLATPAFFSIMDISIPTNPRISLILPVRDAAMFLPQSLESILTQNYQYIEVIAVDDFSTDDSFQILQRYQRKDTRLKVFKNVKKYGLALTLNRCLKPATGKFVVFMDPRDTITKNKLQKQLEFLLTHPKTVAVGTQCLYIDDADKRIGKSTFPALHSDISQQPIHGQSVLFEGIMINRFKIPKDLLYFPTTKQSFLYSHMAMLLMQYGELTNLPEFLQLHRKHNQLTSSTKHFFSLAKLWVSSRFNHDSTPPFLSFFSNSFRSN